MTNHSNQDEMIDGISTLFINHNIKNFKIHSNTYCVYHREVSNLGNNNLRALPKHHVSVAAGRWATAGLAAGDGCCRAGCWAVADKDKNNNNEEEIKRKLSDDSDPNFSSSHSLSVISVWYWWPAARRSALSLSKSHLVGRETTQEHRVGWARR